MDNVRIIDLWQVILQEPRVANKEAALIMQGELGQQRVRRALDDKHMRNQQRVLKTFKSENQKIEGTNPDGRRGQPAMRMLKKQKKRHYSRPNRIINAKHVDVTV